MGWRDRFITRHHCVHETIAPDVTNIADHARTRTYFQTTDNDNEVAFHRFDW